MDIELTFINQSDDQNNSQIVVFQQNIAAEEEEIAVRKGELSSGSETHVATLSSGQKVTLGFKPTIWVGVVSPAQPTKMKPAILAGTHTELPLEGITKANIVMTGGGSGAHSTPYKFTLVPTT